MPFFTIIIPTYNRANMLSKALDSVAAQSLTDWECVVVDDGSTDNTKELLNEYIARDNRFRYIYQENAERSAARNNGIRNAKGEYICFLDSDDEYLAHNLEKWSLFINKNIATASFLFCEMNIIKGGELTKTETKLNTNNKFDFVFTNPIVPARVCIQKDLLIDNFFEEYMSVGEDVALWLKILKNSDIKKSNHTGLNYYLHEDNSVNPKNPSAIKMYEGFKKYFENYPDIKSKISKNILDNYVSKIQTNIAKYYYRNNQKGKAIFELIKAVLRSPIHEHTKYRLRLIVLTFFSNNPNLYE